MFSSRMSKDSLLSFYEAWDWAEQHNADDGRGAHQEDDAAAASEIKEERAEDTKKKHKKKRKRRRHHKDKTKEESEGKEKEKKKKERRKRSRDPRPHIYDSDVEHDKSSSLDEEAMKQFFEAWLEEDSSSETEVDEDAEKAFYNSHNVASSSGVVKTEEEEPQDLTVDNAPQDVPKDFSSAPWNVKKPTWSLGAEEPAAAVPIAKAPTCPSLGATSKFPGALVPTLGFLVPLCSRFVPLLFPLWGSWSHFVPTQSLFCSHFGILGATLFPLCSSLVPTFGFLGPTLFLSCSNIWILVPTLFPLCSSLVPTLGFLFPLCSHFVHLLFPLWDSWSQFWRHFVPLLFPLWDSWSHFVRALFLSCSHFGVLGPTLFPLCFSLVPTLGFLAPLCSHLLPLLFPRWDSCSHFVPLFSRFWILGPTLGFLVPLCSPLCSCLVPTLGFLPPLCSAKHLQFTRGPCCLQHSFWFLDCFTGCGSCATHVLEFGLWTVHAVSLQRLGVILWKSTSRVIQTWTSSGNILWSLWFAGWRVGATKDSEMRRQKRSASCTWIVCSCWSNSWLKFVEIQQTKFVKKLTWWCKIWWTSVLMKIPPDAQWLQRRSVSRLTWLARHIKWLIL